MENKCIHCGAEIEAGSKFCNHCGKKQVVKYKMSFENKGFFSSKKIIDEVNQWLAANNCVSNVSCKVNSRTSPGIFANRYVITDITLEYELLESPNRFSYHMEELSSLTLFSGIGINTTDELVDRWKEKNPDKTVVCYSGGGSHSRGQTFNLMIGIGNQKTVQTFLLYRELKTYNPQTVASQTITDSLNASHIEQPYKIKQSSEKMKKLIAVMLVAVIALLGGVIGVSKLADSQKTKYTGSAELSGLTATAEYKQGENVVKVTFENNTKYHTQITTDGVSVIDMNGNEYIGNAKGARVGFFALRPGESKTVECVLDKYDETAVPKSISFNRIAIFDKSSGSGALTINFTYDNQQE